MLNDTHQTADAPSSRRQSEVCCFILEISKSGNKLTTEKVDADWLMKQSIGDDRSTQSVFQASSDIEEVEILAALLAGRKEKSGPESRYAIRIFERDFDNLPISCKSTPNFGTTGIQQVDRRHFDLNSNADGYTKLMKRLLDRLHSGEHRVRLAGTHQIALMLQSFSNLEGDTITTDGKKKCDKLIKHYRWF